MRQCKRNIRAGESIVPAPPWSSVLSLQPQSPVHAQVTQRIVGVAAAVELSPHQVVTVSVNYICGQSTVVH